MELLRQENAALRKQIQDAGLDKVHFLCYLILADKLRLSMCVCFGNRAVLFGGDIGSDGKYPPVVEIHGGSRHLYCRNGY